jgi:hypothetical protein
VTARVRTGARPNALAVLGDRLWVGAFHDDYLTLIDRDKGRAVSGMRPTVGQGTADLAVADGTVWIGDRHDRLLRLDRNARAVAPPIPLPATVVALTIHDDDIWAALEPAATTHLPSIVRVDRPTGTVEATLTVAHVMSGIVYARGSLWTMHGAPNFIMRRDPATLAPKRRVDLQGGVSGPLVYGAGAFWATAPDQDQLIRYDPRTRKRASVSVGSRPIGLAVQGRRVWVASNGSSALYQVAARTLQIVGKPVRVPLNPLAVLVRGDAIWVSCVGEDVVVRVRAPAA